MKIHFFTIILCVSTLVAKAQLQPNFSLYREQTGLINPAIPHLNYTNSTFNSTIAATYRMQWFNVKDAPVTQVLSWENMLDDKNLLVGVSILNDKTGDIGFTNAYARCAYRLMFSQTDNRFLTVGLSIGGSRFYANLAEASKGEVPNRTNFLPDLNMGAYYHHGNSFYVGISAPQLLGTPFSLETTTGQKASIKRPTHLYGMAGMFIEAPFFGNDVAYLEPNIWFRYLPANNIYNLDVGLRAKISQTFWAGSSYNLTANTLNVEIGSSLGESVGFDSGLLRIGFGFVVPLGSYWTSLGSGGEVHISYAWGKQ